MVGAARTQAPSATNYDVGSPTWGDLRAAPLPSAMEVQRFVDSPQLPVWDTAKFNYGSDTVFLLEEATK
ncbi:hypothetical protein V6N11_066112 [Hibiscus sabdariffa]|uniref:Uncharacterized protein n=2 Tax=Hibiscus sabdariffa TaxID=183260 RepID=A0ABR2NUY3_9ROSI